MQRNKGKRQSSIEKRVARGAAWLDRVKPDWFEKVDLDRLDLRSGCNCVLGQIVLKEAREVQRYDLYGYGDVVTRDTRLGRGSGPMDRCSIQQIQVQKERLTAVDGLAALVIPGITAKRRGFELTEAQKGYDKNGYSTDSDEWDALTAAWRVVIEAKLAAVTA